MLISIMTNTVLLYEKLIDLGALLRKCFSIFFKCFYSILIVWIPSGGEIIIYPFPAGGRITMEEVDGIKISGNKKENQAER